MKIWSRRSAWLAILAGLALTLTLALLWGTQPTPLPAPAPQSPLAASSDPLRWGGALNSVAREGEGWFSPPQRRLADSVPPADRKYVVELNSRSFLPDPAATLDEFPAGLVAQEARVYLQFVDHPSDAQRQQLAQMGVKLEGYLSAYAWMAQGSADALRAVRRLPFVRALAIIDARDRLAPQVYAQQPPAYALAADGRTRFQLLALSGTTLAEVRTECAAHPTLIQAVVSVAAPSMLGQRFEVIARSSAGVELASLSRSLFVDFVPPPIASRDATTDSTSNIDDVRDNPPNLNGTGIKVAIREIGKPAAHQDFDLRLTRVDNDGSTASSEILHSTAVVGQAGSAGVVAPAAKGVATNVSLYLYSPNDGTYATTDIANAAAIGARISNHSYGPPNVTAAEKVYKTESADWDAAIRANNLLACFAVGNEGNFVGHIDFFVGAKNTIAVGSTTSTAKAGPPKVDGAPASFSHFGPTWDGRVKPDLMSFGDGVTLCEGNSNTQIKSGTSFSSPVVTGVAALLFQHYRAKTGAEPTGALTKALLCNSAADLGLTGPDIKYGFGLVDAKAAIDTINLWQSPLLTPFFEGSLNNGETRSFTANVQSAGELKVTLCWYDVAGTPMAASALVNNLDLLVTAPDGTKHYPYSLNLASPTSPATNSGPNTVDPIEQVIVSSPVSGNWTITVSGTSVPSGPQSFAVCVNTPKEAGPVAAVLLASPTSGTAPLSVAFSAAGSTGAVTYSWNFGDSIATFTEVAPTHTFTAPGTFTVTLTVSDGKDTSTATTLITVTKREVEVFPSRAHARLDFLRADRGKFQFTLTVPELVMIPAQWRELIASGELADPTLYAFTLSIGNTRIGTFNVDAKGRALDRDQGVTINYLRGEIKVQLNGYTDLAALFAAFGMTSAAGSGIYDLPVQVETPEAIYQATFKLLWHNPRGKTGTAKSF